MGRLDNRYAIVTGAARGLGKAIALALAREGAHVAIADIREDLMNSVADKIREMRRQALAIRVDVSNSAEVQAMVDRTLNEFKRIDILVNNAGVVGPQGPLVDLSEEGWDYLMGVNLKGVYLCLKAVIPHMIAQRSGKIVNIASVAGKTGEPFNCVYSASKAGVISLTQGLALELAPYSINVNAVCPHAMSETELMGKVYRERSKFFDLSPEEFRKKVESMIPLPRRLRVEDVANMVVFLASDDSEMVTGEAINVSGGAEVH